MKYLTDRNRLERYDNIIQDQIKEDIVEKVNKVCKQEVTEEEKVHLYHMYLSLENQPKQLN